MAHLLPRTTLDRGGLGRQRRHVGDRDFGKNERRSPDRHALGAQKGVEMPMLPERPSLHRMGVVKVLGVAFRVVDLPIGVMPPLRDRFVGQCFADDVAVARGKFAPAIADYRGCRGHSLDLGRIHEQTFSTVLARQTTTFVNER